MRFLRGSVLFICFIVWLSPRPAFAYAPVSELLPRETPCLDRDRLAGVIGAEGGAQPYATQLAMAQIVVAEAEARGMTVCALTERTHFVSVVHYARAHPESWTARQLAYPHEEWYSVADDALRHLSPLVAPGMGHFDGDGLHILFKP